MSEGERRLNLTVEDWLAIQYLLSREEPADMDPVTKEAWPIIQDAAPFAPGVVRRVRQVFGHDLEVMYEGETWIVMVKYNATPVSPYNEPDGPMPDERKGRLISAGVHGNLTSMTVEVSADSKALAERIALGVARWWAHIYRLPEPVRVTVMDNEIPEA
ncbi:hypothetical protein [Micromonospora cremea]|uniref:Uncharacterized protein n=1 Tax=Micromonospora cremea TaxID=709881 RepID=A0A1N5YYP1_9ACTN|nr:hypothetical protein [Micromonospora cremea]SIN14327.1 hypothetical protein SAMN04489832_3397 [Micromonospora cremea]